MYRRVISILLACILLITMLPAVAESGDHRHVMYDNGHIHHATCTEPEYWYGTCGICGKVAWKDEMGPALGHTFSWTVTEPTCTEQGTRTGVCDRCGHTWVGYDDALGHKFGQWVVVEYAAPGCSGKVERACTVCGYTEEYPYDIEVSDVILKKGATDITERTEGDVIEYVISIENKGPNTLYDVEIADFLKGGNEDATIAFIPEIKAGESENAGFEYTVSAEDIARGYVENTASAVWTEIVDMPAPDVQGETQQYIQRDLDSNTVVIETEQRTSYIRAGVKKTAYASMDEFYVAGQTARFGIDFYDLTGGEVTDVVIRDYNADTGEIIDEKTWSDYGSDFYSYYFIYYTVTAEDVKRGSMTDYAVLTYKRDGVEVEYVTEPVTIICGEFKGPEVHKYETSTPANGMYYTEGETATFTIVVTADDRYYAIKQVEDYFVEYDLEEVLFEGDEILKQGDVWTFDCEYTITASDVRRGYAEDRARVYWALFMDDLMPRIPYAELELTYSEPVVLKCDSRGTEDKAAITVEKREVSSPENGLFYTSGETAEFEITVKNAGTEPVDILAVRDILGDSADDCTFEWLWGDETSKGDKFYPDVVLTFYYQYTITDADVLRGYVQDKAEALYNVTEADGTVTGKTTQSGSVFISCGESGVEVVKQIISTPANGLYYTQGEEVKYSITVTNKTGCTLHDISIWDEVGYNCIPVDAIWELVDGDSVTSIGAYTVTAEDVERGYVTDAGYCIWGFEGGTLYFTYSDECSVRTGGLIGNVDVIKEVINVPVNGVYYTEGESIDYRITIVNNYQDVDVVDVTVNDEYLGVSENIGYIAPGQSVVIDVSMFAPYYVSAADVEAGSVFNQAYATFIPYEAPEYKTVFSNPVTVPCGKAPERDPFSAAIKKQVVSVPANGMYYVPGEEVYYMVSVTNTGIVPINETDIFDVMFTATGNFELDYAYTYMLEPGETVSHMFNYTVTVNDAAMGMLYDTAYARLYSSEGVNVIYSNECAVPVGYGDIIEHHDAEIFKYVASTPANGAFYVEGEKVVFTVVGVPNDEIITDIDDILVGKGDCIMIKDMDTSFIMGIECWNVEYIVSAADVAAGKVVNIAWLEAETVEGYEHTVYSEEVEVPCGKGDYVSPFGSSCNKVLVAANDTDELIRTDLCATHSAIEAAAMALATDKERADMWERALYTMYSAMITATGNEAIATDRSRYMSYIGALRNIVGDEKAVELMRERTTELCCEAAGNAREDLHTAPAAVLAKHGACNVCVSIVKSENGTSYTTETVTAGAHMVTANTAYSLMLVMKQDESQTSAIWKAVTDLWNKDLTTEINGMMAKNVTAALSAKANVEPTLRARNAALAAVYEQDPAVSDELFAREVKNMVIMYCENVIK